ncbi:5-methylcytosine-specific restriction enzyme subunit McrC [Aquabacterium commune]|uniref:5-methylcytosine-specific restriction enzyme subunit McrC n=1 Tax=Aquabacterium commune TaxID=70586 RepID=A0A4R6RD55_9BURK|nr:McrC family protein [Aquabacterium commune]TDP83626.1 5-methylcytosine-specific restriction enzyme subunit McrC [Aquabacterium commune]
MNQVTVCEYASLTTHPVKTPSLALAQVSPSAFDHLCTLSEQFRRGGASLVRIDGRTRLRLDGFVGVIQTPCGTTVEILPKHTEGTGERDKEASRALLRKLIQSMFDMKAREVGVASLETFNAPLTEWVMARFLDELDHIVQRGLRFNYQRVEEEQPYLRGQLNVMAQLRQPPGREHRFQIRHDVFTPDRAENRLLRSTLNLVCKQTTSTDNWRLAHELSVRLAELPDSRDIQADFRAWGTDRLMAHYQSVRPWCEIILLKAMPLALQGQTKGLSLLFPMDRLFEQHVAACLRRRLDNTYRIRTPAASQYLCQQGGKDIFRLEPDIFVEHGPTNKWVLDAKWKLLDETNHKEKFDLSQADFYQLYAYGQKYMGGVGNMALIYPMSAKFSRPLAPFDFSNQLRLHVLPFDLTSERIIGLGAMQLPALIPAVASNQLNRAHAA